MHYAEFAEDEVTPLSRQEEGHSIEFDHTLTHHLQSQALLTAIKEYENNKWKVIGQKVGKPAKVRTAPRLMLKAHPANNYGRLVSSMQRSISPTFLARARADKRAMC